jgi:O-antigen/teichoic acid export membrane protein
MRSSASDSKKELLKGAASLSIAALFVKVLGVAYKIPLSHILGDDGMGYFNTAYTVYTFFFLICTAGVPKAITLLATENNSGKNDTCGALIKTASGFRLASSFTTILSSSDLWASARQLCQTTSTQCSPWM